MSSARLDDAADLHSSDAASAVAGDATVPLDATRATDASDGKKNATLDTTITAILSDAARDERVVVAVRLRPPEHSHEDIGEVFSADEATITIHDPLSRGRSEQAYCFSRVFQPEDGQGVVFDIVAKPLVDKLLEGFNSCCLAYGQTGSGKTHSVFGKGNAEQRGMLARSIEYLFERIAALVGHTEVGMAVSFVEIYLNQVRDLGKLYADQRADADASCSGSADRDTPSDVGLDGARASRAGLDGEAHKTSRTRIEMPAGDSDANAEVDSGGSGTSNLSAGNPANARQGARRWTCSASGVSISTAAAGTGRGSAESELAQEPFAMQDLAIHETPEGLVYIEDLSVVPVRDIREVLDMVNSGIRVRATSETKLNAQSSRSHTIFSVSIAQKAENSSKSDMVASTINFVDLAGSERLARSKSEGLRFQEAVVINSSLTALGKVILALASGSRSTRHVPYRDSKLTRILQNSLGGNSYLTLLTTINPSADNFEESKNSLSFADRCKHVHVLPMKAVVENQAESRAKLINRLNAEIDHLTQQLQSSGAGLDETGVTTIETAAKMSLLRGQDGKTEQEVQAGAAQDHNTPPAAELPVASAAMGSPTKLGWGSHASAPGLGVAQQCEARSRLEEERRLTQEAEREAEKAMRRLEDARRDQAVGDEQRRREVAALRAKNKEYMQALKICNVDIARLAGACAEQRSKEFSELEGRAAEVVRNRCAVLRQMPELVYSQDRTRDKSVTMVKSMDRRWDAYEAGLVERHEHQKASIRLAHKSDCSLMEAQYDQRLQKKDMVCQQREADLEEFRAWSRTYCQQLQSWLLAANDVVQLLFGLVGSLEAGVPSNFRSGVRPPSEACVRLASSRNARARRSDEALKDSSAAFEQLSRELAALGHQVEKRGQALRAARSGGGGVCRGVDDGAQAAPDKGDVASGPAPVTWDVQKFARDFCDMRGEAAADPNLVSAPLQHLNAARLRSLCIALADRARMSPTQVEVERDYLRDSMVHELSSHSCIDRIQELEREIADYRARIRGEEKRAGHLDVAMQSCVRLASRPTSAIKRPSSAKLSR